MKKQLQLLLERAKAFNIREEGLKNTQEFLDYNEFGLCFDIIVTQLHEYDIKIDVEFYNLIEQIARKMKLSSREYTFMQKQIQKTE